MATEAAFNRALNPFASQATGDAVAKLALQFQAHMSPDNYDDALMAAFARKYAELNFRKARALLAVSALEPPRRVLDVGSGGGAFAVALLSLLDGQGRALEHLCLVDRSAAQLRLTTSVVQDVLRLQTDAADRALAPTLSFVQADARSFRLKRKFDLILAGHVLTENRHDCEAVLQRLGAALAANGAIVIAEQRDDPVWTQLPQAILDQGLTATTPQVLKIDTHSVDSRRAVKWCVVRRQADWRRALLDRYFVAWTEQSPRSLASIFTEDATYQDKPFAPVMQGLAAIEDYWHTEVVEKQIRPRISLSRVVVKRDELIAHWTARFLTRDRESVKTVTGILWCETTSDERLIRSLTEVYRSQTSSVSLSHRSNLHDT